MEPGARTRPYREECRRTGKSAARRSNRRCASDVLLTVDPGGRHRGRGRPADVIVADVVESSFRFLVEARDLPLEAWSRTVAFTSGAPNPPNIPALRVAELRLEEVEVHHVDLDVGYGFADTPPDLADRLIGNFAARRAAQGVPVNVELEEDPLAIARGARGVPTVRGKRADVLSWLAGRSLQNLSAGTPDGAPPALPPLA